MKAGSDRKYTTELRQAAVKQVQVGRGMSAVARSLEMSSKTLANWVYLARKGTGAGQAQPARPVTELKLLPN
jgi:transposase